MRNNVFQYIATLVYIYCVRRTRPCVISLMKLSRTVLSELVKCRYSSFTEIVCDVYTLANDGVTGCFSPRRDVLRLICFHLVRKRDQVHMIDFGV